ncbi:hypothetical protein EF903_18685 [Streptomyces sp. WAC05292]|uniref:hypothetical protein n=1 Tax=Streptomyces sp. WAC05292 TaxID=2487418 RepID=UPI000F73F758|nr:hypothetical protein [Streptomyces sp. WAC05292]RSS86582.1 hypothetical protein EF903_18685 [Streptomyces sp. WAC05292]
MNRRPLVIAAAVAAVVATAAFALPNLPPNPLTDPITDQVFQEESRRYPTAADAPRRGPEAFTLPSWVPGDARDIRIHARTTGGEARLIRFTLGSTPLDGPQCRAGAPKRPRGRELDAKWWPRGIRPQERPECRDAHQYQVAVRGRHVYAWTDGTPSPGAASGRSIPAVAR